MNDRILLENEEHQLLLKWVKSQPLISGLFLHFPNEGRRSGRQAATIRAKGGLTKGVSDFFLALPNSRFGGLWIELKKKKLYAVSEDQTAWIEKMRSVGYAAEFAFGWEDAKKIIEDYLNFIPKDPEFERCIA